MNRLTNQLWSLSRDENVLTTTLIVCLALAGISYLSAGLQAVPSTSGGSYQSLRLTADSRLLPP